MVFSSPWASTNESLAAWASGWLAASVNVPPSLFESATQTLAAKLRVRVDAGADGRAADRHVFFEPLYGPAGANDGVLGLGGIAGEYLADADRRGVHQMRAADLDDLVPLLGFCREVFVQPLEGGDQDRGQSPCWPRCASRSGTCRSTTGPCSHDRSDGPRLPCPSRRRRNPGDGWPGWRSLRWRWCWSTCRSRFDRCRRGNANRVCRRRLPQQAADDRLGEFLVELAEFLIRLRAGGLQMSERVDDGGRHRFVVQRESFRWRARSMRRTVRRPALASRPSCRVRCGMTHGMS